MKHKKSTTMGYFPLYVSVCLSVYCSLKYINTHTTHFAVSFLVRDAELIERIHYILSQFSISQRLFCILLLLGLHHKT